MIKPFQGDELHLFINDKTVAHASGFTLDASCDLIETAPKTDYLTTRKLVNKIKYSLNVDALLTNDINRLFDIFHNRETVTIMIGTATKDHLDDEDYFTIDSSRRYFYCDAIIDSLNIVASNGMMGTFNATLLVQGKLIKINI